MTTYPTLTCSLRASTGSNAARQMRRRGQLPANVCGHGDPLLLQMEHLQFLTMTRGGNAGSQIVKLTIDGVDGGLAMVKRVQRDTVHKCFLHVDLQRISLTEDLHYTVAVVLEGEPVGLTEGGKLEVINQTIHLRGIAGAVPESLTFDISEMKVNDTLTAGQLALPEGCVLDMLPEACIAAIRVKLV
jgi:large subunit ribosomal protein L25